MYQDARYADLPPTDAALAGTGASASVQHPGGLTWRHAASGVLLLVALPVFAVAAIACLPVLMVTAGGQGLLRVWALAHSVHPARDPAPTPSH